MKFEKPPSVLVTISESVYNEPDFEKAQSLILEHLKTVNQTPDIKRMEVQVRWQIFNKRKLDLWVSNNLLAWQGLQTIQSRH